MKKSTQITSLLAICGVLLLGPASGVGAATPQQDLLTVEDKIEQVLAEFPEAKQTKWNEVRLNSGDVILTLESPYAIASAQNCASGRYCVFNRTGYTGDKLTFSGCTLGNSVAALPGNVRSLYNARTSKKIRAYSGSTLLATVNPGAGKASISGTVTTVSCW